MLETPQNLTEVFAPFNSADLELLAAFAANLEEPQQSRFGQRLDKLGDRPQITELVRFPGGGGKGKVRVRHAPHEMRAAIFAVARRLRLEHEYGSLHQACSVLKGSAKRSGTPAGAELAARIEAARRRIRVTGKEKASVGAVIRDEDGERSYATREQIFELAEYGQHFHQNNEVLRRDWKSLPEPLLEPSVDEALRVAAEAALALGPIVKAVLDEPALRRR